MIHPVFYTKQEMIEEGKKTIFVFEPLTRVTASAMHSAALYCLRFQELPSQESVSEE